MKLVASSSSASRGLGFGARFTLVRFLVPALVGLLGAGCASPCTPLNAEGSVSTYQVTGTVLQLTETRIVIEKGSSQWELVRTPSLRVTGELKVGAQVTITYLLVGVSSEPRIK